MPELPDIELYLHVLRPRVLNQTLDGIRVVSPFVLRSVDPPIAVAEGRQVCSLRRLGKRIVIGLDDELFLVFHLMIAGRFRWQKLGTKLNRKIGLAAFDFPTGRLMLTEASKKKRASLHLVRGESGLAAHDPGGIEPLTCDEETFNRALQRRNHTLKRALTDPHIIAGIGNAYSDEILHAARLSPFKMTGKLADEELQRLYAAVRNTLQTWTDGLRQQFGDRFPGPGDVIAFRDGFAIHGRFGKPCPDCGKAVQRIRYAENETNYCARCQTEGRVLADRSLSRLLKDDWPRTIEELEGG